MKPTPVYKDLIRAIKKTFSQDTENCTKAMSLARQEFRRPIEEGTSVEHRLDEAKETAVFLRRNFVQARQVEHNHYKLNLTAEHEINDKILPIKTKRRCC